jgi:CheY-like chemotaxis protein
MMKRGEPRLGSAYPVEFERQGRRLQGICEDLSRDGLFVRTDEEMAIGEIVSVSVTLPDGSQIALLARAVHRLPEDSARALGRHAGVGFHFIDPESNGARKLVSFLLQHGRPVRLLEFATQVLVAEANPYLQERMSTALRDHGFSVEEAVDGADAVSACLDRPPDILLIADEQGGGGGSPGFAGGGAEGPLMDGWSVIETLKSRPKMADTLVVLSSDRLDDLTRLRGYRLGVDELLPKPFTDEELVMRVERLAGLAHRREAGRVVLRGRLDDLHVGTLLTLLDYEKKTGILMARAAPGMAKVFVRDGRIIKVESPLQADDAFANLRELLDWTDGSFEFVAADVLGKAEPEVDRPTPFLLLEHERLKDEAKE